ncbi:hypothetical protein [Mycolicibacterium komossense]|uniref:Uncharacterized protein n=1 Tax=Mycolicibacterium komossense TaxID=1779 RepID=A0ABT3CMD2_9MYCO|nr:hypothetical protein [Mycolicibacterium komossense]MCV7230683.1 hypothetical protein [Mycolicibacterium komossense]
MRETLHNNGDGTFTWTGSDGRAWTLSGGPLPEPDPLFIPNDREMMAARGAIAGIIGSVALNREQPSPALLDNIIQSVVLSLRWQPPQSPGSPKTDRIELSIGGQHRDIPVNVSAVDGLTSYSFTLDLGVLGRQRVEMALFHRGSDLRQ